MSVLAHVLLTDEQLKARAKRLIKASETPVRSVGMGATSVALAPVNIDVQLLEVMQVMHDRGLADLSRYLQTETFLYSVDPHYATELVATLTAAIA